jgi:hypothetical protein
LSDFEKILELDPKNADAQKSRDLIAAKLKGDEPKKNEE